MNVLQTQVRKHIEFRHTLCNNLRSFGRHQKTVFNYRNMVVFQEFSICQLIHILFYNIADPRIPPQCATFFKLNQIVFCIEYDKPILPLHHRKRKEFATASSCNAAVLEQSEKCLHPRNCRFPMSEIK